MSLDQSPEIVSSKTRDSGNLRFGIGGCTSANLLMHRHFNEFGLLIFVWLDCVKMYTIKQGNEFQDNMHLVVV